MIGAALGTSQPYGERMGGGPPKRQRLHDTKPFESTAEARKRKKQERQRKKQGRKGK